MCPQRCHVNKKQLESTNKHIEVEMSTIAEEYTKCLFVQLHFMFFMFFDVRCTVSGHAGSSQKVTSRWFNLHWDFYFGSCLYSFCFSFDFLPSWFALCNLTWLLSHTPASEMVLTQTFTVSVLSGHSYLQYSCQNSNATLKHPVNSLHRTDQTKIGNLNSEERISAQLYTSS